MKVRSLNIGLSYGRIACPPQMFETSGKLERDINQQFMIDFNYNSNHFEGNTLTYGQTKLLLRRIARLLVNYIFLRHNYPMLVIRSDDRNNYLKVLHQCDLLSGKITSDGAHASLQQTKPLVDYISSILENKLTALIQLAKGEISEFIEAKDDEKSGQEKVVRKSGQKKWSEVLELITENPKITRSELSETLGINPSAIQRHIQKLKNEGIIERIGGDKGGYWKRNIDGGKAVTARWTTK